jgi:hypothetical protein
MPVVLDFLRTRQHELSATAEIRTHANSKVLKEHLPERPHAFNFALTYLTKEGLIERSKKGFYKVLPSGLRKFTEDDGKRLTDKYERRGGA